MAWSQASRVCALPPMKIAPRWFLATRDGRLRGVDLDDGKTFFDVKAADSFQDATLAASADGWAWRSSGLTARVGCSTT